MHPMIRWHRLLGIVSAVIVIATTVTGLLLNHSHDLNLSRQHLESAAINARYGHVATPLTAAFKLNHGWISQAGAHVYRDGSEFYRRDSPLRGVRLLGSTLYILFSDRLVIFDRALKVVDEFGALDGLELPLTQLAALPDSIVLETAAGHLMQLDIVSATWQPVTFDEAPPWVAPRTPPPALVAAITAKLGGDGVSYERVLQDLHSGRFFGLAGTVIVDAAAVVLLLLALSGVYLWFKLKRSNAPGTSRVRPPP
jgi:hypothetical protein